MMCIGVIGAGVMGTGLAQDLVAHGFGVVLIDRSEQALAAARRDVEGYGRFSRLLGGRQDSAGQSRGDYDANVSRVVYSTDLAKVATADFVVENITEDWALKKEVYPVIDEVCPPDVVFAANTSAIPITKLAALTSRPDRIVGMHFMNPVPMKQAVEVIRGWHTSDETLKRAEQLLTVDDDAAGRDRQQPGDHRQQRALAAAARADHRDEFAGLDGQRDRVERGKLVAVAHLVDFRHVLDRDADATELV